MDFTSRPLLTFVGCSGTPGKAAHDVPLRMREQGFPVQAVNPRLESWEGQVAFPRIPEKPGWVVIFRPGPETPTHVRAAIAAGAEGIWLQLGITNVESRALAEAAGVPFVEDKCVWVEFQAA